MGAHNGSNVTLQGFSGKTGRFHFSIPSESKPGHEHQFTTDLFGATPRCSCHSFVQRGYCTLTQTAAEIARDAIVARYESLSDADLSKRYGELAAAILDRSADDTGRALFALCGETLNARIERVLNPQPLTLVESEPLSAAA
jgi:hypothetical protein